jgi:hypothetical protein
MRRLLAIIAMLVVATDVRAAAPRSPAQAQVGGSCQVARWWFQYLGEDGLGERTWLYPHFDGIHEIFGAPEAGPWTGDLGTRFDPRRGVLENTFNGAEVLNEFLDEEATAEQKREAARLLALWLAIHPARETPYYARDVVRELGTHVSDEARAWVEARVALRRRLLERVGRFGVEVPGLETPVSAERGPREYYRRMLRDGYLDIAVVGGNLRDKDTATYHSWEYVEELRETLAKEHGFKSTRFRRASDETLSILHTTMLGRPITVRMHMTGGSLRDCRIRRAVANYVEGLAHADLFIYHGHSNYSSGAYYISERFASWSRFQIGLRDQRDLSAKCHLLGTRPYQLLCFQSCSSYHKYVQPIREHYARTWPERPGHAGFMGTSKMSWFEDFVPRYAKLIELLLKERGARTIQDEVNAIKPRPTTPPMVLRGFLQPPTSFILPAGVTVANVREEPAQRGYQVLGDGSDGRTYRSTEVFAQNFAGEIVQVAAVRDGLYGLTQDGRVYFCGRRTCGAAVEASLTGKSDARFAFIGITTGPLGMRLILIGTDGKVYRHEDCGKRYCPAYLQPPRGVAFAAIGEDAARRLIAVDDRGGWYVWDRKTQGFVRREAAGEPSWEPSLLGGGTESVLCAPDLLPVASGESAR